MPAKALMPKRVLPPVSTVPMPVKSVMVPSVARIGE